VEVLIDHDGLSPEELASACAVSIEWIERHVQGGLLHVAETGTLRFTSVQLLRARRLADIERTFEAFDYAATPAGNSTIDPQAYAQFVEAMRGFR